ncbi:ABC transporter substrate-binding protein [Zobellella endophytica]|uniref:ABC transporter substrate-binding protein n=1 Tax=Zobellella endophytica TaxID=2116700 RepID=A0A2P7R1I5_9GAMM|nr:iron-siderophore ABC transporter substrate-binding protein [Zobellella endophytica]PSJ44070.1 ABC transporter substrate-binding protein [Zobellella endophytica]
MSGISFGPAARTLRAAALVLGALLWQQQALAEVRTLDTKYGAVAIDGEVERVVTLYEGALDTAHAVGLAPLGAIITRGGEGVASYMQQRVGDIAIVGGPRETNLEAVIALQPDLILAASTLTEEQYRLLSAVAPTLVPDVEMYQPDSWKREARFFARALNREAELEQVIARVDERATSLKARFDALQPAEARKTSLARWMPQGPLLMSPGLFSASLLQVVGFEVRDAGIIKPGRPHSSPLSQENLALIDGDWLFLATLNSDGREALAAAEQSPAFSRLQVVRQQHVVPVDGQLWTSASGPLAADAILDDIEAVLASLEP